MSILRFSELDLSSALLGKPFAWHGRGPGEYDCWGLVRECLLRTGVRGVPDYPSSELGPANSATMLDALHESSCRWRKLRAPQAGAVVVFRLPLNGHLHCGYMLTADLFLHTTEQTHGAVAERVSSPLWARLVIGYYLLDPQRLSHIACPESV